MPSAFSSGTRRLTTATTGRSPSPHSASEPRDLDLRQRGRCARGRRAVRSGGRGCARRSCSTAEICWVPTTSGTSAGGTVRRPSTSRCTLRRRPPRPRPPRPPRARAATRSHARRRCRARGPVCRRSRAMRSDGRRPGSGASMNSSPSSSIRAHRDAPASVDDALVAERRHRCRELDRVRLAAAHVQVMGVHEDPHVASRVRSAARSSRRSPRCRRQSAAATHEGDEPGGRGCGERHRHDAAQHPAGRPCRARPAASGIAIAASTLRTRTAMRREARPDTSVPRSASATPNCTAATPPRPYDSTTSSMSGRAATNDAAWMMSTVLDRPATTR